jgi:hypothetical protein
MQRKAENDDGARTLAPSKRILVYRPSSANTDYGCTQQPDDERPMEDVGERRHRDPNKDFPGFRLAGSVGCLPNSLCLVPTNRFARLIRLRFPQRPLKFLPKKNPMYTIGNKETLWTAQM